MLVLVFMISGFSFRFLAMYIIDTVGLGVGVVAAGFLTAVGSAVRLVPGLWSYPWALAGQCLCALAQAFVDIAAPKLAANWFPPDEVSLVVLRSYSVFFVLFRAHC
jgi:hypothetical protein